VHLIVKEGMCVMRISNLFDRINICLNVELLGSEICALLGYYAASCANCLPTFRYNVSVPSSRVKSPSRKERKKASDL
jgi:hypothetical protein